MFYRVAFFVLRGGLTGRTVVGSYHHGNSDLEVQG